MLANLKDDNSPASARRPDQMVSAYFFAANTSLTASPGNCNSEKLNGAAVAKDLEALEDARVANVPKSVMSNLPAFSSQNRLDDLSIVIPCEHWRPSYLRTKSRARKSNEAQVLANICITVRRKYK